MKSNNNRIIICTGFIGGLLMSYGYLNGCTTLAIFGTLLIGVMLIVIFWRHVPKNIAQKTETSSIDVMYTNTINIPKPNIELRSGDCTMGMVLPFGEKKDIIHRLKWWMFCKVFPFRYEWIESEDKQ